jgi:hypothetical protein
LNKQTVKDPLKLAMDHGNEPPKGANIDAKLERAVEETLRRMHKID